LLGKLLIIVLILLGLIKYQIDPSRAIIEILEAYKSHRIGM